MTLLVFDPSDSVALAITRDVAGTATVLSGPFDSNVGESDRDICDQAIATTETTASAEAPT